jgi:hypothetical protein
MNNNFSIQTDNSDDVWKYAGGPPPPPPSPIALLSLEEPHMLEA